MPKAAVRKFSSLMRAPLLNRLKKEAETNGQSVRYLLEQAVEHYLDVVLPSSRGSRPQVLRIAQRNIAKYDELLKRLAKAR